MKKVYFLLVFFLIGGSSITSFAFSLQEGLTDPGDWAHDFKTHGEQMINASKSNGSGINIGFDIIYDNDDPLPSGQHAVAAFISGEKGLNLCTTLENDEQSCNFTFSYSIDGADQLEIPNSATYAQWDGACDMESILTLQDCFNENSFGQIFKPSVSGQLTEFTIDMTFLNESGGPIENLEFYLYEIDETQGELGSLLQSVSIDIQESLIQTDWEDYQFESDDFHTISIPFSDINLAADTYYGVFPGGGYVPGELPGEGDDPVSVPLSDTALYLVIFLVAGTLIIVSRKTIMRF